MKFSKKQFMEVADKNIKRLLSKYIDEIDGKDVVFTSKYFYGKIILDENRYVLPVYKEWCTQEQLEIDFKD